MRISLERVSEHPVPQWVLWDADKRRKVKPAARPADEPYTVSQPMGASFVMEGIDAQLSQAIQKLARERDARQNMPALHERKARTEWQLRTLEVHLGQLRRKIKRLERNFIASWFGNREQKLVAMHEALASVQQQFEEQEAELQAVEKEMSDLGTGFTDADELHRQLNQLLEKKAQVLMQQDGETAARMRELDECVRGAKTHRQRIERAKQVGNHLVERLFSMTRAVGRARTKSVNAGAVGSLAATAITTALQRQTAKPSMHLVSAGLDQVSQAMNELQLRPDDRRTHSVEELRGTLTALSIEFADAGVGGVILDSSKATVIVEAVQKALGLLEEFGDEAKKEAQDWESQWRRFVESA